MIKLNINIKNHEQHYTVSEMRRRLAQVLSKLNGDQSVTFSFRAELTDYSPVRSYGEKYHENLIQSALAASTYSAIAAMREGNSEPALECVQIFEPSTENN